MKKEFIVEREGKSFVLYAGLLDLAHEKGLKAITTTLVQLPSDVNGYTAIAHATVELADGDGGTRTFTGLGDANATNVTRMMAPHLIRMAETRAKARALRDATNIGVTAFEELGDDEEGGAPSTPQREARDYRAGDRSFRRPASSGALQPGAGEDSFDGLSAEEGRMERVPGGGSIGRPAGGAPASQKQIETIRRMTRAAGEREPENLEDMSRAEASKIIERLIGQMAAARS